MLSVVPNNWREYNRNVVLPSIIQAAPEMRGLSTVLRYNPARPGQVWDTASLAMANA